MFGLVISGRPIDAQPTQINPTQLSFTIPSSPPFSHLTLFLLPGAALPPDFAATVWIQMPPSQDFRLLGALSLQKQSAIFKLSGVGNTGNQGGVAGPDDEMVDEGSAAGAAQAQSLAGAPPDIVLGISIEPIAAVEQQLATLLPARRAESGSALVRQQASSGVGSGQAGVVSTKVLAQRIIGNAFNFLTSFGDGQTVPLKAFQDWWAKFEKKIELDPTFLERAEQA